MSAIPSTTSATSASTSTSVSSALSQIDTDDFLELMIEELQNQDPLDPTDSSAFLNQITQIREIDASDRLTDVLGSVLEGQNLTTASGLIGKSVTALDGFGNTIEGTVTHVSVDVNDELGNRTLNVHVSGQALSLDNIRQINEVAAAE